MSEKYPAWQLDYFRQKKFKMTRTIKQRDFNRNILESKTLAIVNFKTEWNGSSRILTSMIDEISEHYKGIADFFTIDIEQAREIANEYAIMEIPAILFFKNGIVIDYISGLASKMVLTDKIERALINSEN